MNQNAEYSAVNDAVHGQFFRRVWAIITPYWHSEEKVKAWTLLIAVIALSLISVGISVWFNTCLLYTSPSPRDRQKSRMPSSA